GKNGDEITVYLHPARYTQAFFREHDTFTVSFYPESCRKALMYKGSHSGRDGDKAAQAGLTPVPMGDSVTFREAELSFLCRKVYAFPFAKEGIAGDVQAYYRDNPGAYPVDENGDWQPHWIFIGEVLEARRRDSGD
ncbi:MAG: flavin reductase, partial [Oscillospiraceae bacterium]|nr:flavin reductase [Oscillospiraceae bacterium]